NYSVAMEAFMHDSRLIGIYQRICLHAMPIPECFHQPIGVGVPFQESNGDNGACNGYDDECVNA
ncbi:MAG: hypothetical protein QXI71_06480, partial [Candidatus Bathyarchaeia archaeon]